LSSDHCKCTSGRKNRYYKENDSDSDVARLCATLLNNRVVVPPNIQESVKTLRLMPPKQFSLSSDKADIKSSHSSDDTQQNHTKLLVDLDDTEDIKPKIPKSKNDSKSTKSKFKQRIKDL